VSTNDEEGSVFDAHPAIPGLPFVKRSAARDGPRPAALTALEASGGESGVGQTAGGPRELPRASLADWQAGGELVAPLTERAAWATMSVNTDQISRDSRLHHPSAPPTTDEEPWQFQIPP
jgi:hypothetical protein